MKRSFFLLIAIPLLFSGFSSAYAAAEYTGDGTYTFAPGESVLLNNNLIIKPQATIADGFTNVVFDVYQDSTKLGTTEIMRVSWDEKIFYFNTKAFGAQVVSYEYVSGVVHPRVALRSVLDEVNITDFSLAKDYGAILGSNGTFAWRTDVAAKGRVEYCKNAVCSNPLFSETSGANSKAPSILTGELEPSTVYYYRIISTTAGGSTATYPGSGWSSFISSDTNIIEPGLEVMQISFSGVTSNSATVSWRAASLDGNGEYRYSTNLDELQELPWQSAGVINGPSSDMTFRSKVALSCLSSNTTYYVNVRKTLPVHSPISIKAGVSKTLSFKTSSVYSPVQVIVPRVGQIYSTGSDINIELVNPSNFKDLTLELIKGSAVYEKIGSMKSDIPITFYHWPSASREAMEGNDYRIRVYPTDNPANFAESGIFFIGQSQPADSPVTPLPTTNLEGRLVKVVGNPAVFIIRDGNRYYFPDQKTYYSWYGNDFSSITTIALDQLNFYRLSGLVTYKSGSLIKIQSDPKVYEVINNQGDIKWISDEATAIIRHGALWAKKVNDVFASLFVAYNLVGSISEGEEQTISTSGWQLKKVSSLTSESGVDKSPSLAFGGSSYGVVRVDKKNTARPELYFTKLNNDGGISTNDVRLTNHDDIDQAIVTVETPKIVWAGDRYGVLWNNYIDANQGMKLTFITLDSNGSKLSQALTITDGGPVYGIEPKSLIWNGEEWAAVFTKVDEYNGGWNKEIYFATIKKDGSGVVVLKRITHDSFVSDSPVLTWDGDNYAVVWRDAIYNQASYGEEGDLSFTIVNKEGDAVAGKSRITQFNGSSLVSWPNIFSSTSNYYLFFNAKDLNDPAWGTDDETSIYLAKLSSSGQVVGSPLKILSADYPNEITMLSAAEVGNHYGVVYRKISGANNNLFFIEVDAGGNLLSSEEQITTTENNTHPELIYDGSDYAVIWNKVRGAGE